MYPYNIKKSGYMRRISAYGTAEDYENALYNKPYPEKNSRNSGSVNNDSSCPDEDKEDNNSGNASDNNANNNMDSSINNNTNNNANGYVSGDFYDYNHQNVTDDYMKELMIEALKGEKADFDYYSRLANMGISDEDNKLIYSAALDEKKHYDMLKQIYKEVFGECIPNIVIEQKALLDSPVLNFEQSILEELEGAEFYRQIMFSFLNTRIRDMIFEIITDEQGHAQKFNYLYSKYN